MPPTNQPPVEATVTSTPSRRRERGPDQTPTLPLRRTYRALDQTPTLPLAPVEIEAILHNVQVSSAAPQDVAATRTVESVRIALGSSELSPMVCESPSARGPRRPRETLTLDQIKIDPDAPTPYLRKR